MKRKSYLTNLLDFYKKVTSLMDEESSVDVDYLKFSKAFDAISNDILIDKLKAVPC